MGWFSIIASAPRSSFPPSFLSSFRLIPISLFPVFFLLPSLFFSLLPYFFPFFLLSLLFLSLSFSLLLIPSISLSLLPNSFISFFSPSLSFLISSCSFFSFLPFRFSLLPYSFPFIPSLLHSFISGGRRRKVRSTLVCLQKMYSNAYIISSPIDV